LIVTSPDPTTISLPSSPEVLPLPSSSEVLPLPSSSEVLPLPSQETVEISSPGQISPTGTEVSSSSSSTDTIRAGDVDKNVRESRIKYFENKKT